MPNPRSEPAPALRRPVLPWKLVAGGFLHFILPAYLIALVIDLAFFARPASVEATLRDMLPFSARFLLVYGLVALAGSLAALLIDPLLRAGRARREARDPQTESRRSEARLLEALRNARGRFGAEADQVLAEIRTSRWRHADSRFQTLSHDLAEVVRTSTAALASADRATRAEVQATALRALRLMLSGLRALESEESRRDQGDAETMTRYVEARYGSDFAGEGN